MVGSYGFGRRHAAASAIIADSRPRGMTCAKSGHYVLRFRCSNL